MNIKTLFKIILKPTEFLMGLLVGGVCLVVLLLIVGYGGGFLMYIAEMLIVGAFVAAVLIFPIHFILKLISNAKVRESLEIAILLSIIIIVGFLVFINIHKTGGIFQNFQYYLNDKIGNLR